MTAPTLVFLPFDRSHVASTAALLARALDDDPAYRFLFPHEPSRHVALTELFAANLDTHLPYRCTYILASSASGKPVATVTVRPPGGVPTPVLTMIQRGLLPFGMRHGPKAVQRLFELKKLYDGLERDIADDEPHLHVHMMAVMPEFQGSGVGTRLLRESLSAAFTSARSPDFPVVLTTHNTRNVTFYRRAGFTVSGYREVAPSKGPSYPVWGMSLRQAGRPAIVRPMYV